MPQGDKPDREDKASRQGKPSRPSQPPAAGPHAKPKLTDPSKTPGSGTLPSPDHPHDGDATSG